MTNDGAREEFAVLVFVEPRAFDIEQHQSGHKPRECKRIDGELGNGLVSVRIGLVVENVDGAISDLQKIDMAGDIA